jgi:hypothetical protein
MAMPWSRAKVMAAAIRESLPKFIELNRLFWACLEIQEQASRAAGHRIPLVIENVIGAQRWVGPAKAHYGSFYLWGDIESVGGAITPVRPVFGQTLWGTRRVQKIDGYSDPRRNGGQGAHLTSQHENNARGVKQSGSGAAWFDKALDERRKAATAGRKVPMNFHQHENTGQPGASFQSTAVAATGSNSRKAASAMIAKIPLDLARFIARSYKPAERARLQA